MEWSCDVCERPLECHWVVGVATVGSEAADGGIKGGARDGERQIDSSSRRRRLSLPATAAVPCLLASRVQCLPLLSPSRRPVPEAEKMRNSVAFLLVALAVVALINGSDAESSPDPSGEFNFLI